MSATPHNSAPIADALVLVFGRLHSLRQWEQTGTLDRELALYRAIGRGYGRVFFVSGEGQEARQLAERHHLESQVIALPSFDPDQAPAAVERLTQPPLRSATIMTDDLLAGELPIAIASRLRVAGVQTALVARGGSIPSRFIAHDSGGASPAARAAAASEHRLLSCADLVIGSTPSMIADLVWRDSIDPLRCAHVPNHVLSIPEAEIGRDRSRLLFCGPLIPRKRVDMLIRAVSLLPAELRSGLTLEVIGDGPERESLRNLALHLQVNVSFQGWLPHDRVLASMSSCALYIDASELENQPRALLDAMNTGAAVVVADIPGLRDLVQTGVTGIRVQPSAEAFAQTLDGLLQDEDWRQTLGAGAARHIRAQVSIDTVAPSHLAAHRKAHDLARSRPNPVSRLSDIRLLVCDFDGVFTDNSVLTDQDGVESVRCSRSDGLGLDMLRRSELPILVLSKEANPVVAARCRKLKIECLHGIDDKLPVLQRIARERSLSPREIAYVGNDVNDLGPLSWVGLPVLVSDAQPALLAAFDRADALLLSRPGGRGAIREICDLLRAARTPSPN